MAVSITLAMSMGNHVDGHVVDIQADIGSVIKSNLEEISVPPFRHPVLADKVG